MDVELLAPAGNQEKLSTAIRFGADAVYFGGKFGLRAQSGFNEAETRQLIHESHANNKKAFATVNIYARNADFIELNDYLSMLREEKADGVIVSDPGILSRVRSDFPELQLHISTQANTTNRYAAKFYEDLGATRIVLARELSLTEIAEIRSELRPETELEAFVHGAMCISYSGRCLLSNFLSDRDSNHGNCVQACRWKYTVRASEDGRELPIEQDERGTYLLNSKDLMMIRHLQALIGAGVTSLKIEGRMKTAYYLATVVNAYRRTLDLIQSGSEVSDELVSELYKVSNRGYTTGFYLGEEEDAENRETSVAEQRGAFCGVVIRAESGRILAEMRNRFRLGDRLEIVSPFGAVNRGFTVFSMRTDAGEPIDDARLVQQQIWIDTDQEVHEGDFLRLEESYNV